MKDSPAAAVGEMMRTQPDYTESELAAIDVPVAVVQGEHDEFIRLEHAACASGTRSTARWLGVSRGRLATAGASR